MSCNATGNTRGACIVVGITGGSGSGKTVFAERLHARLGADAVALSHDDYYKHLPHMTAQEAAAYDFDSPDALETNLLVEHLRMLKAGNPVWVPAYDFASHARSEAARRIEPAPVILVEGLLIMCDPDLLAMCDLTVFVDAEPDLRVLRRIIRDCNERGADLQRAADMYLEFSKPAHERYVEPFKEKADVVVSDALNDASLEAVVSCISRILA